VGRSPAVLRTLDPAERYFWLLARVAPMNAMGVAETDVELDEEDVRRALAALQRRHPLLRARVQVVGGDLAFVSADGPIPLRVLERTASLPDVMARELDDPLPEDEGPAGRCLLVPLDGGGSAVLLVVDHTVADALAVMRAVQYLVRQIGVVDSTDPPLELPPPLHECFSPELRSPSAAVEVLRAVRAERSGQGPPADLPFHDRTASVRASRLDQLVLEPGALEKLRAEASACGSSVFGMLAAATLRATASLLGGAEDHLISLGTPTDLRRRVDPPIPDESMVVAIGLLSTPYQVRVGSDPDLARQITEQTRREVARGESHLFYRFARIATFAPTPEDIDAFRTWTSTIPQNLNISNMGVIDHADDPPWVRSVSSALGTSTNQPMFLAAQTYRGTLLVNATTDGSKLAASVNDQLLFRIAEQTGAQRRTHSIT
jgi:hypothetical protein